MSFYTRGNISAPVIIAPENLVVIDAAPEFRWVMPYAANKCIIEVAPTPNFTNRTIIDSTLDIMYNPTITLESNTYYWRIRATNNGFDYSPWTETRKFTIVNCSSTQRFKTNLNDCGWTSQQAKLECVLAMDS